MIISNSRRFIFCHLHKTAGEAITEALEPHLAWNDIILGHTAWGRALDPVFARRFKLSKHSPASQIKAVVGDAFWDDSFTFSVVRHPFDRARSLYHYLEKRAGGRRRGLLYRRVSALRYRPLPEPWNWPGMQAYLDSERFGDFIRHPGFLGGPAAKPQVERLSDPDTGRLLVGHVIRFENLAEEFDRLAGRIGVAGAALPVRNRSRNSTVVAPLSADDRTYLATLYADDLAAFGYRAQDAR